MGKSGAVIAAAIIIGTTSAAAQDLDSTSAESAFVSPGFAAIRVGDVDAASSWYQRVLGLDEVNRIDAEDGRYSIRILSGGGLSVELIEERGIEPVEGRRLGLFKVGLYVSDIDAFYRRLEGLGVDQDARIFMDEALNARSFVFRDLAGNRIQVFQRCDGGCRWPSPPKGVRDGIWFD